MHNHNSVAGSNPPPLHLPSAASNLTPEQLRRQQEEIADRDRQASALAAAGMVAENVKIAQPNNNIGLQPPPPLPTNGLAPPAAPSQEIDSINWNMMDAGGHQFDDMDLDFAQLFDPVNELAHMHAEGAGSWQDPAQPTMPSNGGSLAPNPLASSNGDSGQSNS